MGHPVAFDTTFLGNRFAINGKTADGTKVQFYTDSAGGVFLAKSAAERLKLKLIDSGEKSEGNQPMFLADFPNLDRIPSPLGISSIPVFDTTAMKGSDLGQYDGMLGQRWFSGRTWTFDYGKKKLIWRAQGDIPKHKSSQEQTLYFQTAPSGKRKTDFARLEVELDGEKVSFLLDTGATDVLDKDALAFVGDKGPAARATSFMAKRLFDKLHGKHPDWRVYNKPTTTGNCLLEVPAIKIGGQEVGPVWFSVQPDSAFHVYMAQWMDRPTEGALGGSAFKYFRLTVDWPNALAVFEKIGK